MLPPIAPRLWMNYPQFTKPAALSFRSGESHAALTQAGCINAGCSHNESMLPKTPKVSARLPKFVVRLSAVCASFLFVAIIEPQEKKTPTSPGMSGTYQILTPTDDVDFADYMKNLLIKVRRNWYAVMPEAAQLGTKGRVVVRFRIQKDGTLFVKEPTVELSSKDSELDKAATRAIKESAPFKPLPDAFHGPAIELRFLFNYNMPNVTLPDPPHSADTSPH
jgi:TonB family protein